MFYRYVLQHVLCVKTIHCKVSKSNRNSKYAINKPKKMKIVICLTDIINDIILYEMVNMPLCLWAVVEYLTIVFSKFYVFHALYKYWRFIILHRLRYDFLQLIVITLDDCFLAFLLIFTQRGRKCRSWENLAYLRPPNAESCPWTTSSPQGFMSTVSVSLIFVCCLVYYIFYELIQYFYLFMK